MKKKTEGRKSRDTFPLKTRWHHLAPILSTEPGRGVDEKNKGKETAKGWKKEKVCRK
jgi:hypothetical protein